MDKIVDSDELPEFIDYTESYDDIDGVELSLPTIRPESGMWRLSHLYINDQSGGIRVWKIGFDESTNEIVKKHGYEITPTGNIGQLQEDRRNVKLNTRSLGYHQQAHQECWNEYRKKYRQGYRPLHETPVEKVLPQLALNVIDRNTGK